MEANIREIDTMIDDINYAIKQEIDSQATTNRINFFNALDF